MCGYRILFALSLSIIAFSSSYSFAQQVAQIPVGTGQGQLGLIAAPNEECRGPVTITAAASGGLAILDDVNHKILIVTADRIIQEIRLPEEFVEPVDFLATSRGYLVAGMLGQVIVVNPSGEVIARASAAYDPQAGAPRIIAPSPNEILLENLQGTRTKVDLNADQVGNFAVAGLATAMRYGPAAIQDNTAVISSGNVDGPLSEMRVTSQNRIVSVRPVWVDPGAGALVAVQGALTLPEDRAFVRLVALDAAAQETEEAYVPADSYFCNIRKPFTRLSNGDVVRLKFAEQQVSVERLSFMAPGTAVLEPISVSPDRSLISETDTIFAELEQLNGTSSISSIALASVSRQTVLQRARAALEIGWFLAPMNYSHPNVENQCDPIRKLWHRPSRLDSLKNQVVEAIPYRWGGHFQSLTTFVNHLNAGRLAGDDCTCRNANCVTPYSTGLDCSGFVSMAWMTDSYFTTVGLPASNVSSRIRWNDLRAGDIANKAGSHVRLVESISPGLEGLVITVLESAANRSCGGVCRRSYAQAELQNQGYKPLRRVAITD
ncbi:hypothetical protein HFO02_36740 [Rhizobium laguerreae]|nr:hypothetical protein [Rhizobium laguerreae]MBY3329008.1 hypothetical protein [Rhizobium laguerreae]